ncbi:MAG: replication-associated recombination protein A [Desulfobacteraceae bacterium]|nr:MAG: replication-associated recombination protein A [Desulfobacteraceae bacterium]
MNQKETVNVFDQIGQEASNVYRPLADRMRPRSLDDFLGQDRAAGKGTMLRNAVEKDQLFSMILWGPPGCGKTTLSGIIAAETRSYFVHFSAVLSGVKQIRTVIEEAEKQRRIRKRTLLFVDEIHRFNKAQQDAFLHHVESGLITLLGATTENPSFEVIPPLLSRCRVITLEPLANEDIRKLLVRALQDPERGLGRIGAAFTDEALSYIVSLAGGDARIALNSLEIAASLAVPGKDEKVHPGISEIGLSDVEKILQEKVLLHDKAGESHYNLISAFHKSLRGSDPDAALYWLERMLQGGEDPFYIARRMVRFASEDVGNADPQALGISLDAMEAFRFLGHPEGELALAQAAVYLATAPKSNRVYAAFQAIDQAVKDSGSLPVPMHIRNAPTRLMKELGYGRGYRYAHDYKDAYVHQTYLPERLKDQRFYFPSDRGYEKAVKDRLERWYRLREEKEKTDSR